MCATLAKPSQAGNCVTNGDGATVTTAFPTLPNRAHLIEAPAWHPATFALTRSLANSVSTNQMPAYNHQIAGWTQSLPTPCHRHAPHQDEIVTHPIDKGPRASKGLVIPKDQGGKPGNSLSPFGIRIACCLACNFALRKQVLKY